MRTVDVQYRVAMGHVGSRIAWQSPVLAPLSNLFATDRARRRHHVGLVGGNHAVAHLANLAAVKTSGL